MATIYGSIHQFQKSVYPLVKQQDADIFRIDFIFRDFALATYKGSCVHSTYLWNYKRYMRVYTCWSLFPSNSHKGSMRNGRIMRHIARFESALTHIVGYSGRKSGVYKQGNLFRLTDCALLCATKVDMLLDIEKFNSKRDQPPKNIRQRMHLIQLENNLFWFLLLS